MASLYSFKAYLRTLKLNKFYRKLIFKFKAHSNSIDGVWDNYETEKLTDFKITDLYKAIDFKDQENSHLLQSIYSFLFANPEPVKNIKVYEYTNAPKTFVIVGSKVAQKTVFY